MASCLWSEDLAIGVPVIDRDHRRLIEAIDRVRSSVGVASVAEAKACVGEAMAMVLQYTHSHFDREEMLMRLSGYPGYEQHRSLHKAMVKRADALDAAFRARPSTFTAKRFCDEVAGWLVGHITAEDVKIKPWVEKLEAAA